MYEVQTRNPRVRLSELTIGSAYTFTVKAQNLIGVRSSGETLNIASLAGDVTSPSIPSNPSTTGGIRQITVNWTEATEEDLALTLIYYNDTDNLSTATRSKTRGEEFVYTLADGETSPKTKYFWLSSIDYSGNESDKTDSFTGTSVRTKEDDIDGDDVFHKVPSEGLTYYWPCNSITDVSGSGNEELQEVVAGKTGIHSGSTAPTLSTDSPTGKSIVNGTDNSGWTLLSDTDADALEGANGFAWSIWFKSETTTGDSDARIIGRDASDGWALIIDQDGTSQGLVLYGEPSTESMGAGRLWRMASLLLK